MPRPLSDYLEIRTAAPTSFSADGRRVLVASDLTGTAQLYRVARSGGEPVPLTAGDEPVGGAYLPGRSDILMTMDAGGNERHQLYLLDDEPGTAPRPLVVDPEVIHWPGGATRDGRLVAYASNARNGVDFDVYVRPLGAGASGGGPARRVFDAGGWCRPAGFSPDGRWLAVLRLTERNGDNDLWLVDLAADEGAPEAVVHASPHDDEAAFGPPAWLPDSSAFYLVSDTGRDLAAVARYDVARRGFDYVLERPAEAAAVSVDWPGTRLLLVTAEHGYTAAELLDPHRLTRLGEVPLPARGIAGFVWSRDGHHLAYRFTAPDEPGDAWLHDLAAGTTTRLTRSPRAVPAGEMVSPEVHRYRSFDGEQVPVFLFRPRAAPGAGPAPVVVWVHGGPEAQFVPSFAPVVQYLVGQGYAVAAPNVRGSTGYGKRWHHLDDVRKRLDAVADLGSLHDWLAARPGVDASRAALVGGSYGGYMVLAGLVFQPERWAAGVTVVGISSLVTFLENTSVWRRAFREREYGSLEHDRDFLLEASPLTHLDRLRAPLFIIHGANDPRVPVGEAEQLHAALAAKGVPAELLVYDDEGHGLAKLANRLDAWPKAAAFLERVLRP